jgi:hypothetical protein
MQVILITIASVVCLHYVYVHVYHLCITNIASICPKLVLMLSKRDDNAPMKYAYTAKIYYYIGQLILHVNCIGLLRIWNALTVKYTDLCTRLH